MLIRESTNILICPACYSDLELNQNEIHCASGHHHYQIHDGIPLLFWPNEWNGSKNDVTNEVKSFYENTPFPNYDGIESAGDLIREAKKGIFARLLSEQIPEDTRVLEVGCGTGQLSNFLVADQHQRRIIGTDMCLHSLTLANNFRKKCRLEQVEFYQMNLFKPVFKEETFDVLICNGVLHHTNDSFLGFKSISKLVKKNGFIVLGLYNRFGRILTDIRRLIFKVSGDRLQFLDPRLRRQDISGLKKRTWFLDQYKNPHESKHTFGEILTWFDQTGFEFVNSVPKLNVFEKFSEHEKLFASNNRGGWQDRLQVQTDMLFTGGSNGGFFIVIGKKVA